MKRILNFANKNKRFTIFLLLALGVLMVAVFAPQIATHDPYEAVLTNALQPPDAEHCFGTDALGRDVYSRIIFGAQASVSSTLALVAVIFVVGTFLGIVAGYYGGAADVVIMRVADTMIAFPDLILAIAIIGILGPNISNAILAIAVVSWTKYARLSRSLVLKIRNCDYISAARVTGSKNRHVLLAYLLPNALPTMVITAATDIGTIMLSLASLSFLGFGVQPPTPEWGYMLSEGRQYFQSCPWLLWFPGLAIFVVVVIFNLMGDSLRDVLDPKTEYAAEGIGEEAVSELNIKESENEKENCTHRNIGNGLVGRLRRNLRR